MYRATVATIPVYAGREGHRTALSDLLIALLVTGAFAALAHALGMVSLSGALGGFLVGTIIFAVLGPQGFAILALFVVGGSILTRLG